MNKRIHVFGGGTVSHVRSHLALCAPAYGNTAKELNAILVNKTLSVDKPAELNMDVELHLTKMAGGHVLETNEDVETLVDKLVADPLTKIIFFSAAMIDFGGTVGNEYSGKYAERLKTRGTWDGYPTEIGHTMLLRPTAKVIRKIRKERKDIFLVGFKTTCGATEQEQYLAGLDLLKESSCNLVLANDVKTRINMIITPEEASYCVTTDRSKALWELVEMTLLRSHLTFTRSTVVAGEPVPWTSDLVPDSLREVVDHCIRRDAYKPFRGSTVGHFAVKVDDQTFLTSRRKTNFNDLYDIGLVKVKTDGPDSVIAYGSRPSVGGQSQRIVFKDHPEMDCVVHCHCPIKPGSKVPVRSQREFECGSHECGKNTSDGFAQFGNLKAVYLDQHGPNIIFNRNINPFEVIDFIDANFDLSGKTGGYQTSTKKKKFDHDYCIVCKYSHPETTPCRIPPSNLS